MIAKGFPKRLHWQGKVKGETVTMDIEAGTIVAADHKIRNDGEKIDGYDALPGYNPSWGTRFPYFIIRDWKIRWGGKDVHIPRGVYTSVFTPHLTGSKPYLNSRTGDVFVCTSAGGDALMVTMGCGYDAVTVTVAFVITKDGRAHRFVVGGES